MARIAAPVYFDTRIIFSDKNNMNITFSNF